MYIINVEPLLNIKSHLPSGASENRHGELETVVIFLADAAKASLQKPSGMRPEHLRAGRRGHASGAKHAETDWDTDRSLAIQGIKRRPGLLLNTGDARQRPSAGELEGAQPG